MDPSPCYYQKASYKSLAHINLTYLLGASQNLVDRCSIVTMHVVVLCCCWGSMRHMINNQIIKIWCGSLKLMLAVTGMMTFAEITRVDNSYIENINCTKSEFVAMHATAYTHQHNDTQYTHSGTHTQSQTYFYHSRSSIYSANYPCTAVLIRRIKVITSA